MSEPVTVIGANTVVNGNLEGDEDLTIEGRVEGTITLSRTLSIESNGVVHANINVRNAVISGVLVGNVEAEDSVHITEEGRVMGDISAPRVILVDGSSFRGNIDMGNFDVDRADGASAPRPASRPAVSYEEEEEAPAERAPTRVRTVPTRAARKPAAKAPARPKPKPKAKAKPAPAKKAKKKAPAPKVRSVGKSKATRKKR